MPNTRFYYSFCQNLPIIFADNDPINAPSRAFTRSNGSFNPIFWTFLPISGLSFAFIALSLNKDLFKQFIRAYLAV